MSKLLTRVCLAMAMTAVAGVTPPAYGEDDGVPEGAAAPKASIIISNCLTTRHDFITYDTTGLSTTSEVFVAVPGMTKSINTLSPGCVIVTVSAFSFAADLGGLNQLEMVGVTLDGVLGNPSEVQWSGDDDVDLDVSWARQHAAVFAFKNVPAGVHTVSLVFRSSFGGTVFIHRPAMEIKHR